MRKLSAPRPPPVLFGHHPHDEDDVLVLIVSTLSAIGLMTLVAFLLWVLVQVWKALL